MAVIRCVCVFMVVFCRWSFGCGAFACGAQC